MGTAVMIAITLASILVSVGLQHTADRLERDKAASNNRDTPALINSIYSALDALKQRSYAVYDRAISKLESIPQVAESGLLKSYLSKVRAKTSNTANQAKLAANQIETSAGNAQQAVYAYASMPDSYKNSKIGTKRLKEMQANISAAKATGEDMLKAVENKLSED